MYCKSCNSPIAEGAKFCTNCGKSVNEENLNESTQQGFVQEVPVTEPVVTETAQTQGFVQEAPVAEPVVTETAQTQGFVQEVPVAEPVVTETAQTQGFVQEAPVAEPVVTTAQETLTIEPTTEKKANIFLAILSWFIPLVGIILFFVKKKEEPKTAKACGLCALFSVVLSVVVAIAIVLIGIYSVNKTIDKTKDAVNNLNMLTTTSSTKYSYTTTKNNSNSNVNTSGVTNDWKKYTFKVNNKLITLPAAYSELQSATGFNIKSAQEKSYLQGGYYAMLNMYKNNSLALYIEVINKDQTDKLYTDCVVSRVWQSKYQVEKGADVLVFPGGLTVGMEITEEQVKALLGEPTKVNDYSSGNYVSKTLKYNEDSTYTTTNYYEIEIINGKIDSLKLDKRR